MRETTAHSSPILPKGCECPCPSFSMLSITDVRQEVAKHLFCTGPLSRASGQSMPEYLSVPMWGMSYLLMSVLTGAHLTAVLLGVWHLKQSAL